MKFADNSLNAVVGFLYDVHRHSDLWTYPARLTELLARLIICDSCVHVALNRAAHTFELSSWPEGRFVFQDRRAAIAWHADHPLAVHHERLRNLGAWRLSDVASRSQYHDSTVYRSLYRFLEIEHQMVMLLPAESNRVHLLTLQRATEEFTDDERGLLELLGPHLVQAERRLRRLARARPPGAMMAESEQGRAVIVARNDGSVDLCTQQARQLLQSYFRVDLPRGRIALPTPIVQWLAPAIDAWTTRRFLGARPDPLIVAKETRCLVLSVVPDPVHDRHLLTLAEEALAAPPASLRNFGLTPREAEVLSWVAQGKTNGEVGVILGASARTVQKHLEHIFQKLGVESRTSAILRAWQVGQLATLGTDERLFVPHVDI
jgi:DNA-binding CsgD family transcriptional regulator